MGQVLQPVRIERRVITQEGKLDVAITLNLNITLNSKGEASITVSDEPEKKVTLEIPDFETPTELVDFGD